MAFLDSLLENPPLLYHVQYYIIMTDNKKRYVVFARMPTKDVTLLKNICKARGEDVSDFVRRSIYKELATLSYLNDDSKKALGIKTENKKSWE